MGVQAPTEFGIAGNSVGYEYVAEIYFSGIRISLTTRDEAKKAVFEYIWIFYNRKRIHEANGYKTPEEYYNDAA